MEKNTIRKGGTERISLKGAPLRQSITCQATSYLADGGASLRRLKGIFPGRLIKISLQRSSCVVSNGIAVHWLVLRYGLLQNSIESSRLGSARLSLPGTAVLTSRSGSPGNYLNRIHLEAGNSACCDNPSFPAYFNSVLWFFDKNIGIISKLLTVTCDISQKIFRKFCLQAQIVCIYYF